MVYICHFDFSLSVRSTASSGYDSSESGSGSESGAGWKYDMSGAASPIMRRHRTDTRDMLVSRTIIWNTKWMLTSFVPITLAFYLQNY